jgi:hypothetical protein
LRPLLVATATDSQVTGSQSLKFYARHAGASTWDLLNGQTVSGTSGTCPRTTSRVGPRTT